MGSFRYDGVIVHIEDRTLAHLQIVIVNKLRAGESFLMSWKDSLDVGDGRSAVWMHPHMMIHFKFEGGRSPKINETWLATLEESANSSRGLIVTSESGELANLEEGANDRNKTIVRGASPKPAAASGRSQ